MLLPYNMQPELSIYYNGALVLKVLQRKPKQNLIELYENVRREYRMTFSVFVLSLDWLYLIDITKSNDGGDIELCS